MAHTSQNCRVDDLRLIFHGVVSENYYNEVEASERHNCGVRPMHYYRETRCFEFGKCYVVLQVGWPWCIVESCNSFECVLLLCQSTPQIDTETTCWADSKDGNDLGYIKGAVFL
jgi:hypothetical protein